MSDHMNRPQKTPTGFTVTCERCQRVHKLEWISAAQLILDDDPDDVFEPSEAGELHPRWICRNVRCNHEKRLFLPTR